MFFGFEITREGRAFGVVSPGRTWERGRSLVAGGNGGRGSCDELNLTSFVLDDALGFDDARGAAGGGGVAHVVENVVVAAGTIGSALRANDCESGGCGGVCADGLTALCEGGGEEVVGEGVEAEVVLGVDGDSAIDAKFGTGHEITFGGADIEELAKPEDAEGFGVDVTAAALEGVGDDIAVFPEDAEDEAACFEGDVAAVTCTVGSGRNFAVVAEDDGVVYFEGNVASFSGGGAGVDATLVGEEDFAGLGFQVAGVACSGVADGDLGVVLDVDCSGGGEGGITGRTGTCG